MRARIVSKAVRQPIYLQDSDKPWDDWSGYPELIIKSGEVVRVLVTEYDDGRVYYTAFRFVGEDLFTATSMRDRDGELHRNCGDGNVVRTYVRYAVKGDYSFCNWG